MVPQEQQEPAQIVISGAGIVGLVLALALHKHVGVTPELYEQASAFQDDVGAAMGMYPNGLRVIRDISPALLHSIQKAGHPYLYRRWERHDGTELCVAEEDVLAERDVELQPIGIRRWRLQRVLYEAVLKAGIPINFGKRTCSVQTASDGLVEITFEDGTRRRAEILFGADGSKSKVREVVVGVASKLQYTGVTCLMGMAELARPERGICFPSSSTTKCHAVFFPTRENEQCFQFHFPIPAERSDEGSWGTLSEEDGKEQCRQLADRLRADGWHERYLAPLHGVSHAVRIGFSLLEPRLEKWVYGEKGRVVLLGDAAHPPIPYIGQGAQMGLEDAGVIASLLKRLCLDDNDTFNVANFGMAMKIYEKMRIPRTDMILNNGIFMGKMQQKRAENKKYDRVKQELIQREVFFHESLPIMFHGAKYDYGEDVAKVLQDQPVLLPVLQEEDEQARN